MTMKLLALSTFAALGFGGAAMACPDYTAWGASSYTYTGDGLWNARSFGVTAGGDYSIAHCGFGDSGFVTSAPDFTFDLRGMAGYALDIRVVSACDAVLLVNSADTRWFYDDDSNGNLDPRIYLTNTVDGYLDVWVGTLGGDYCDATVTLETY
jgi:hypothetical protein